MPTTFHGAHTPANSIDRLPIVNRTASQSRSMAAVATGVRGAHNLLLLLVALFTVMATVASAQIGGSGSINGLVTDPTGAVVPGASVTATNTATNVSVSQTTSSAGTYVLSPLPPGDYDVSISANGFKAYTQQHVDVVALQAVSLKSQLSVGASNEVVTVTAAPPQLNTTDASTGFLMENEDYTQLPLQINGGVRNPTSFVYLTPGVSHGGVAVQTGIFNGTGSIGRVDEVYIEGMPQTSIYEQGDPRYVSNMISVEAVDQFQVVTGNQSAQYQGIGMENYVIKSGGNQIHGSVFEYMRTTALDTWGFFAPWTINPATGKAVKPNEHQSEYGVDLSGPIKKDKIFYFGNYDGFYYHKDNNPSYATYPTVLMQQGNFSELLPAGKTAADCANGGVAGCIYDPGSCPAGSQAAGTCTRTPFNYGGVANNINPSAMGNVTKFMASFLSKVPLANSGLTNNFLGQVPSFTSHWSNTNRVDWKINNQQQFSFIFSAQRGAPYGYQNNGSNPGPLPYTSGQGYETKNKVFLLEHNYSLTSNLINQLKYGYTRFWGPVFNPDYRNPGYGIGKDGGLTGLPAGQASESFPTVNWSGGSSVSGTVAPTKWSGDQDYNAMTNYFSLLDNVQWVHDRHSVTFGFVKEWLQLNEFQYSGGSQALQMNYSNAETARYAGSQQSAITGNSYASFFLGQVDSASFTQLPFVDTGARMRNLSLYAQDDWRVTSKLNVNLGLRWDYYPPYSEVQDRSSWFSPAVTNSLTGNLGALVFAGKGAQPTYCNCSTPINIWYKNFGPRLGVAYSILPTTVLRGGFSITYSHGTGVRNATYLGTGVAGLAASPSFTSSSTGDPAFILDSGVPAYTLPPIISGSYGTYNTSLPHGSAVGLSYADPYLGDRAPYATNWNVGIEQQLTHNLAMMVSYVGSQGHFLPVASGGARGYVSNAVSPVHYNLGTLLNKVYSPAVLAQVQAIDPTITIPYSSFANGTIAQMLAPYPQYQGGIGDTYDNIANSNYNAAQVIFKQRMSNGLQFQFNYTFSAEIDNNGTYRNGYANTRLERSRGVIDEPSIVNATAVYQLPFGANHAWGNRNMFERQTMGGWQLSGIYTYNSGIPLTVTGTGCVTPGGSTCMPNYNPAFGGPVRINGSYGRGQTAKQLVNYLNPGAFINATDTVHYPNYTFGNVARTKPYGLRGPTSYDLDLSLKKNIKITERWNAVLDATAINVTNVVIWGPPATNVGSPSTFGQVTSVANNSRDIQLSLRINY
ncbi:MAG TPA: TonB-dependent receptor [Acidobacteriaceae bacterium]|nr:TonB-dependent receptor [Acidobacteriaceae bacterium]